MAAMEEILNNPLLHAGLGLMSASAPRVGQPTNLAEGLMGGLQTYGAFMNQKEQRELRREEAELRKQQFEAQRQAAELEQSQRMAVAKFIRENPEMIPTEMARQIAGLTGDPAWLKQAMETGRPSILPPGAQMRDAFGRIIGENPNMRQRQAAPIIRNFGGSLVQIDPDTMQARPISGLPQPTAAGGPRERAPLIRSINGVPYEIKGGKAIPIEGVPQKTAAGGTAAGSAKLRESEAKATTYLGQMQDANEKLKELEKEGYDPTNLKAQVGTRLAGGWTNIAAPYTDEYAQRVRQAEEQWAEAYLRFKTGAATNAGEIVRNMGTFLPAIGDDRKAIEQKAAARLAAERDIAVAAGAGADIVRARKGTAPSETTKPRKETAPSETTPTSKLPDGWSVKVK